ncbi:hypothetical protein CP532_2776 [Ophiocordyceps camponoti-leonardi (nom. inval.)]|nr:hypothetical protein CP532_2776 [Ophiocordyceps camponoti-leonardi (nom. inval.)]
MDHPGREAGARTAVVNPSVQTDTRPHYMVPRRGRERQADQACSFRTTMVVIDDKHVSVSVCLSASVPAAGGKGRHCKCQVDDKPISKLAGKTEILSSSYGDHPAKCLGLDHARLVEKPDCERRQPARAV